MYKELPGICRPEPTDTLWRYFSFEKFAILLSTKSIYFATASQFKDPFEGRAPLLIDTTVQTTHTALGRRRKSSCNKIMGRMAQMGYVFLLVSWRSRINGNVGKGKI